MSAPVIDYASAEAFLQGGRSKVDRPLGRNTRLRRLSTGDIAVVLHSTDIAVYHADGYTTVRSGGWKTVTTAARLREYTRACKYSENGSWMLAVRTPALTPAKVQKCRTRGCKGTGTVTERPTCWGPARWNGETACQHGESSSHGLPSYNRVCHDCHGTGRRDYGSKPINYDWGNGSERVLIDADGYAVGPSDRAIGSPVYAPSKHKAAPVETYSPDYVAGHQVAATLRELLPGLREISACPVPGCIDRDSIESTVVHLNDRHRWTREQIADWLDALPVDLSFPTPA